MKIELLSLPFLGFLQATGLLIYISLISAFMINGSKVFGKTPTIYAPLAFLLLFIISAIITALMALGRAGFLFWEKRYKEAFTLTGWTITWSILYLAIVLTILIVGK